MAKTVSKPGKHEINYAAIIIISIVVIMMLAFMWAFVGM